MKNYFRFVVFALLGLMSTQWASAQDVTISPETGDLIAAATQQGEAGSAAGYSSQWRHNQLPLTLNVADFCKLTEGGELANPAGNINQDSNGIYFTIGDSPDGYFCISLPKGFKFTGYSITLLNNRNSGSTGLSEYYTAQNKVFYETNDLSYLAKVGQNDQMNYDNANDYENYQAIVNAIQADVNHERYLAVAKPNGSSDFVMGNSTSDTKEYIISRTSMNDGDMGNHLYFRLSHEDAGYSGLTIKSAVIYFSAEGDFTETVSTSLTNAFNGSANFVKAPFSTSKLDLGEIGLDANGHYTYSYANVDDMKAYNLLYQDDAVSDGNLPATPSDGNITSERNNGNYYYGLKNDTYFLECPVEALTTSGLMAPLGYRIVGAKIKADYGVKQGQQSFEATNTTLVEKERTKENTYYITYTYGGNTYYLNADCRFTEDPVEWTTVWYGGWTSGAYYFKTGNLWLCANTNSGTLYTSTSQDDANVRLNDGYIYYRTGRMGRYTYYYLQGTTDPDAAPTFTTGNINLASTTTVTEKYYESQKTKETITVPAFNPAPYNVVVYGTNKTTPVETLKISESNKSDECELTGLNNDAIMFQITGLTGENSRALVTVELTMEALNPFIQSMNIVCHDKGDATGADQVVPLTQTFTASNFMVSGGSFHFYIPSEWNNYLPCRFSFEDLTSNYHDATYPDFKAKGNARVSFAGSEYYGGNADNPYTNIYAANTETSYTKKVLTWYVGTQPFTFNNAKAVSDGSAKYLVENKFSVDAYKAQNFNPKADFEKLTMAEAGTTKNAYLFVCDEPRYNIAPTTATEHRYYAYYTMTITLTLEDYSPKLTWTPVYNNTCYYKEDSNGKGSDAFDTMWGLKVITVDDDEKQIDGFLTAAQLEKAITTEMNNSSIQTPSDRKQILYVDCSEVHSILFAKNIGDQEDALMTLKKSLGENALFYLPKGQTYNEDNFAYMTSDNKFRAGDNIIIADRKPFFAPMEIEVDANNYAQHERNVTWQPNGVVTNSTLVLPFTIALQEGGKYVSSDGRYELTFNKMNTSNALSYNDLAVDSKAADATGYFTPISESVTGANVPYVVKVDKAPTSDNTSFVIRQYGSTISATPKSEGLMFAGDSGTGSITDKDGNTASYDFTSNGSYSGAKLAKADNNIFYFASNMFLSIKNLREGKDYIYLYPFRAVYNYTKQGGGAKMMSFLISYGENPNSETPTDIKAVSGNIDLNAPVYDMTGRKVANGLKEMKGKNLGRGIYVINGAKVIVK